MRLDLAEKRQRVPMKDHFRDTLHTARNLRALTSETSSYLDRTYRNIFSRSLHDEGIIFFTDILSVYVFI